MEVGRKKENGERERGSEEGERERGIEEEN